MAARYTYMFKFFDTEDEAKVFCNRQNANASSYIRKNKPAHYNSWHNEDGTENAFIAWFWVR